MKIAVTCPGCLTRFEVSDKFAGKKGPCPKCKKEIQVPELTEQVVIHAPETTGPKDAKGSPVLKPLRRIETKFSWPVAAAVVGISILLLGAALAIRFSVAEPPTALLAIGALVLGPVLAWGGYFFLRESELEGYSGKELLIRSAACGVIYAITWGLYWLIPSYLLDAGSLAEVTLLMASIMLVVMVVIGAITSVMSLELESFTGVMHYLLYLIVTMVLAVVSGLAIAEPLAKPGQGKAGPGGSGKKAVQVAPKAATPAPAAASSGPAAPSSAPNAPATPPPAAQTPAK